jgi:hypothetical protein
MSVCLKHPHTHAHTTHLDARTITHDHTHKERGILVAKKYALEAQPPYIQTGCSVISLPSMAKPKDGSKVNHMIFFIGETLFDCLYMAPAISWALVKNTQDGQKVV